MAVTDVVVVKLGGEVVASPRMADIAADVAEMAAGGRRRSSWCARRRSAGDGEMQRRPRGRHRRSLAGRRITDADALEVVKMVVAGQVNVDACAALVAAGREARGPPRRERPSSSAPPGARLASSRARAPSRSTWGWSAT